MIAKKFIECVESEMFADNPLNDRVRLCSRYFTHQGIARAILLDPRDTFNYQDVTLLAEDLPPIGVPATEQTVIDTLLELNCKQSEETEDFLCNDGEWSKKGVVKRLVKGKRLGILGMLPNLYELRRVAAEAEKMGVKRKNIFFWRLNILNGDLDSPDFPKGIEDEFDYIWTHANALFIQPTAETFQHRYRTAKMIEELGGIPVVNPIDANVAATDKATSTNIMARKDTEGNTRFPIPTTLVTDNIGQAADWVLAQFDSSTPSAVVFKPTGGTLGEGVRLIKPSDYPRPTKGKIPEKLNDRKNNLVAWMDWWSTKYGNDVFYVQKAIPNKDFDVRAFVIGDRVFASMMRTCDGQFLHNIARGCQAVPVVIPPEDRRLAVDVTLAHGLEYSGVDLIYNKDEPKRDRKECVKNFDERLCDKPYVLEVNSQAGFFGLEGASLPPEQQKIAEGQKYTDMDTARRLTPKKNVARGILLQTILGDRVPEE